MSCLRVLSLRVLEGLKWAANLEPRVGVLTGTATSDTVI